MQVSHRYKQFDIRFDVGKSFDVSKNSIQRELQTGTQVQKCHRGHNRIVVSIVRAHLRNAVMG